MTEGKPVKQVIVIRRDLKMRRGKEIAQGAHAAMAWLTLRLRGDSYTMRSVAEGTVCARLSPAELAWIQGNFRKVTCQVNSLEELMTVHEAALDAGLESRLITDNGLTEFKGVPTVTCVSVGPDWDDRLDPVTGELELY